MKFLIVTGMLIPPAAVADLGSTLRAGHVDHAEGFGGDKMERTFMQYASLPMSERELRDSIHSDIWGIQSGWVKHDAGGRIPCDPNLGYAWTYNPDLGSKASMVYKEHPLILYTTAGGQLSGVGVAIHQGLVDGHAQDALPAAQKKWATANPLVRLQSRGWTVIDVAFRSGDIVCSGEKDGNLLGDTLIVNPKGDDHWKLPLTEKGVEAAGWKRGSCFDGMGWHWFYDTSVGHGQLSWSAENLFPIVMMFHEGQVNAIFFTSTINQVSVPLLKSNEWEPKSLAPSEMCKNLCDKDCDFKGLTSAGPFSTMHIYFRDHSSVTCPSDLHCGLSWPLPRGNCCETSVVV